MMANIGMGDTLILMVLALVVFGPRRLPQIGRQIGKLMYEFRKASNDFKFQMDEEFRKAEEAERSKKQEEQRQRALAAAPPLIESLASDTAETSAAAPATGEPASPAAENPYPSETTYTIYPNYPIEGASSEEVAPPEENAPLAAEPPLPRIQPPSTGETVAAEPPGKVPVSVDSESEISGTEAERSEPAAHHG